MSGSYKKINAPALNHNFGEEIKTTFENIDDNFGVLANRDFVKGDTGDSLVSINVPFSRLLSVDGYTDTINGIEFIIDSQLSNIKKAFKTLRDTLAANRITEFDTGDVNYTITQLKSESNNYSVLVSFQKPVESEEHVKIKSIIPVVYVDQRFWLENLENINNASTIDLSCTITYNELNEDNPWICVQNFPSLYYKNDKSNPDNSIFWIINGKPTDIPARGPKGLNGKAGEILLGLTDTPVSDWPNADPTAGPKPLNISKIYNNNATEDGTGFIDCETFLKSRVVSGQPVSDGTVIVILPERNIAESQDLNISSDKPWLNNVFTYFIATITVNNQTNPTAASASVTYDNIMYVLMNSYTVDAVMNSDMVVEKNGIDSSDFAFDNNNLHKAIRGYVLRDRWGETSGSGYSFHAYEDGDWSSSGSRTLSVDRLKDITAPPSSSNNIISNGDDSKYNFKIGGTVSVQEGSSNTVSYANGSHAEGQSTIATGSASHAEGQSTIAGGTGSHAEGYNTRASGSYSHAEGYNTVATGLNSHAEGYYTTASSDYSHAEGYYTSASSDYSHAEGYYTTASSDYSHAEGQLTEASGESSHAEGQSTTAGGTSSHAEGYNTRASGSYSHAEGQSTTASGLNSHAEGYDTKASGQSSHTEGRRTTASGLNSHAEGRETEAGGRNVIKIQIDPVQISSKSFAAYDVYSNAQYYPSSASPKLYLSLSDNTIKTANAKYRQSNFNSISPSTYTQNDSRLCQESIQTLIVEEGVDEYAETIKTRYYVKPVFRNIVINDNWIPGWTINSTAASVSYPTTEEQANYFMGAFCSTKDYRVTSSSSDSIPNIRNMVLNGFLNFNPISNSTDYAYKSNGESIDLNGLYNILKTSSCYLIYNMYKYPISGSEPAYSYFPNTYIDSNYNIVEGSHVEGYKSNTAGDYSHAEGISTLTTGEASHAEGQTTTASGWASHAEGYNTYASGSYSHAEGISTLTTGEASHAEGQTTTASGSYSHAEGYWTTAAGSASHAEGDRVRATGSVSHAEGYNTDATGDYSHAEGYWAIASGEASHAEGDNTRASGSYSHAEGYNTDATGDYSHAEGTSSQASGVGSHAEGNGKAFGEYSHAEGHSSELNKSNRFVNEEPKQWTRANAINQISSQGSVIASSFDFNNAIYFESGGITTYPGDCYVPGYRVNDTSESDQYHSSMFIMRPTSFSNGSPSGDSHIVLVIPYNAPNSDDSNTDWHNFINNNIWLNQEITIIYEQITYKRPVEETVGGNRYDAGTPVYIYDAPYYKTHSWSQIKSKSRTISGNITGVYKYSNNYIALLTDASFSSISQGNSMGSSLDADPTLGAYDWKDVNLCAISITSNNSGARGDWSHTEGHGCNAQGDASHAEGYYTETINAGEHACGILNETGYMKPTGNNNYYYVDYYVDDYTGKTDRIIFSIGSGDPVNGRRQNGLIVTQGGGVYVLAVSNTSSERGIAEYRKLN